MLKNSRKNIPLKIKTRLWLNAGGRCEYEGCNEPLWHDSLTFAELNKAYISHIIADSPNGPRGHQYLSKKLETDIKNLMLLCSEHQRLIDNYDIEGHPVKRLQEMKRIHEERIENLTSIQEYKKSHIILYGANIENHYSQVSYEKAREVIIPNWFPAEPRAIELSLKNSSFKDSELKYWEIEREHLNRQYNNLIRPRLASGEIKHLSIFGFAPQPLLIELGHLLSDIPAAEVYQLHREPPNWEWQSYLEEFKYIIYEPKEIHRIVALNLSLSATINNSRISSMLDREHSIWTFIVNEPNNDFLKSREQLSLFRKQFRKLLDDIKTKHGEEAEIHLFLAVPVAVAVEIGRVWMPKVDLPLIIYDQNRKNEGFSKIFKITNN